MANFAAVINRCIFPFHYKVGLMITDCQLYKGFLDKAVSDRLFNSILAELKWAQPNIKIFGKFVPIPRMQVLFTEENIQNSYKYSGMDIKPIPFFGAMSEAKELVEKKLKRVFNTALVNLYRNGNDAVGWHADDESLLGKDPVIVSLSLGESRYFHFRKKKDNLEKHKYLLENGDLFVMGSSIQKEWQHAILKEKKVFSPRINITFRNVV